MIEVSWIELVIAVVALLLSIGGAIVSITHSVNKTAAALLRSIQDTREDLKKEISDIKVDMATIKSETRHSMADHDKVVVLTAAVEGLAEDVKRQWGRIRLSEKKEG